MLSQPFELSPNPKFALEAGASASENMEIFCRRDRDVEDVEASLED